MLAELTVKDFLDKVACSEPVPGGGSIAALNGALASALSTMVARLTVGKKGYEASEDVMLHAQTITLRLLDEFIALIDKDSALTFSRAFFQMSRAASSSLGSLLFTVSRAL